MKKINLSLLVFVIGFHCYSYAEIKEHNSYYSPASASVWKIHKPGHHFTHQSTGFFIDQDLFVTNLTHIHEENLKDITLLHKDHSRVLHIEEVQALSIIDNLVVLKTKENVRDYLKIGEKNPKPLENFFTMGYPNSQWVKIEKVGKTAYEDKYIYAFFVNHSNMRGASGSPVLNQNNQVIGVLLQVTDYTVEAVKVERLMSLKNQAIKNNQNLDISFSNLKDKTIEELEKLATKGVPEAQYHLTRWLIRNHPGDLMSLKKEISLLEESAKTYPPAQYKLFWMYEFKEIIKKDSEQNISLLQKAAEKSYPFAQRDLFESYYQDIKVEKDFEKAFSILKPLAEAGDPTSQYYLAIEYYDKKKNFSKKISLLKESAESNFPHSQVLLAIIYYEGRDGVKQDLEQALKLFKKAADQEEPIAQYYLGEMYEKGLKVKKDLIKAVDLYETAVQNDFPKALEALKKLANLKQEGNAYAQRTLSRLYYQGMGVERSVEQAFYWLQKSADQGEPLAQYNLSQLYHYGVGVKKDLRKAFYWLKKSAEQGEPLAQYNLYYFYYQGVGVGEDAREAFYWLQKAAKQNIITAVEVLAEKYNDAQSQYNLGLMYVNGTRVRQNIEEAKKWYQKAADQGHEKAKYGLALINQNMNKIKKDSEQKVTVKPKPQQKKQTLKKKSEKKVRILAKEIDRKLFKVANKETEDIDKAIDEIKKLMAQGAMPSAEIKNQQSILEIIVLQNRNLKIVRALLEGEFTLETIEDILKKHANTWEDGRLDENKMNTQFLLSGKKDQIKKIIPFEEYTKKQAHQIQYNPCIIPFKK